MEMSKAPFNAQASVLTAVLAAVTALVTELGRQRAIDPERFGVEMDKLLADKEGVSVADQQLRDDVASLIKKAAREDVSNG